MRSLWVLFIAFFVCGAASRFLWDPETWRAWLGFPIPFGLFSGWLIARNRFPIYVILCIAVWNAAYRTTSALSGDTDFLAFSLGGLIGGAGLLLSAGLSKPSLYRAKPILMAAAAGTASAWAFFIPESWNFSIAVPFAVWQGVVGTTLVYLHDKE